MKYNNDNMTPRTNFNINLNPSLLNSQCYNPPPLQNNELQKYLSSLSSTVAEIQSSQSVDEENISNLQEQTAYLSSTKADTSYVNATFQEKITQSTSITCKSLESRSNIVVDKNGTSHPLKGIPTFQFPTTCVASAHFVQTFNLPQEFMIDPTKYWDSVCVNGDYIQNSGYWPLSATALYNGATPTNKINQIAVLAYGTNSGPATLNVSFCFTIPNV